MNDVNVYETKYDVLIAKLEELYKPRVVEIAECYKFHCRKQEVGETVQDFYTNLRKLATNCGFGSFMETAIRNQFVFGLECSAKNGNGNGVVQKRES